MPRPGGWPWWTGRPNVPLLQISSALRARRPDSYLQRFLSLQQSFLSCAFVIVLGGGCFLMVALYLERDQAQARQPDTGTRLSHTQPVSGRNPIGARSTGRSLSSWPVCVFICSFVHSFKNSYHILVVCQARLQVLEHER